MKYWMNRLKEWACRLKTEIAALYLAYRKPGVPWYAKVFAVLVVGYALSPVDLIPDFIPVLGYLDDLILIPLGIYIAVRLIPAAILAECRIQAEGLFANGKPRNRVAALFIVLIWMVLLIWLAHQIFYP